MALIKCMECGTKISDKSSSCPACGCPTSESLKQIEVEDYKIKYKDKLLYKCPICSKEFPDGAFKCDLCGFIQVMTPSIEKEERERIEASRPKCPTCNSTRIKKIGTLERGASIVGLGIFSKKINKSFKCESCGYMW